MKNIFFLSSLFVFLFSFSQKVNFDLFKNLKNHENAGPARYEHGRVTTK